MSMYHRRFTFHTGMKIRSLFFLSFFYLCFWNSYHFYILWPKQKVHTYTRGEKMFNVFVLAHIAFRHRTAFQFHIYIGVPYNDGHISVNIRNNFFFYFFHHYYSNIAWKTYENATTRWLSLALVCFAFGHSIFLPLMKDNQKSLHFHTDGHRNKFIAKFIYTGAQLVPCLLRVAERIAWPRKIV